MVTVLLLLLLLLMLHACEVMIVAAVAILTLFTIYVTADQAVPLSLSTSLYQLHLHDVVHEAANFAYRPEVVYRSEASNKLGN